MPPRRVPLETVHTAGPTPPSSLRRFGKENLCPPLPRSVAPSLPAFTLIELLVVMAIIAVLAASVIVASSTLINKAKTSNTQALLTLVRDAVEEFEREQTTNPTITRARQGGVKYADRYGPYPPDELEVFTPVGIPGSGAAGKTLAPGGALMVPGPGGGYPPMNFYTKGRSPQEAALEHRDLSAMMVAIEVFGDASAAMLDRIDKRYWFTPLDDQDPPEPAVYLDRPENATEEPNGKWDAWDLQVRWIADDWGNPISYMAQRDWVPPPAPHVASSNRPELTSSWNHTSTELVRLNGGRPVIFSYGPDGSEQLTRDAMGEEGLASLVGDFADNHLIDNPLNADNVYANPALKDKLAAGIEDHD